MTETDRIEALKRVAREAKAIVDSFTDLHGEFIVDTLSRDEYDVLSEAVKALEAVEANRV